MMIWVYLNVIRDNNRVRNKLEKITKKKREHEEKMQFLFTETNTRKMQTLPMLCISWRWIFNFLFQVI